MARKKREPGGPISFQTGCWVKYHLNLRNITYKTVAARAGLSENMVSHLLTGRKNSPRLKAALADILGYPSFEALIAASQGKGGVA
ncbi:MAG: helix-turn-helix transcriptional regulator [Treponema sp.]|jgi:transcriptional regulator with XRE-family HTH domain|nr:helix-turn-helix transcriptional regulator [Treponema sp.]